MRIPILGEKVSWLKGFFLFYLFFLVIFFAAAPFLTLWLYSETSVTRTLLPQLIGFCMQGGFLVVLFAFYEKRATVDTRRERKLTLRHFLEQFVQSCLSDVTVTIEGEESLFFPSATLQSGIDALAGQGLSVERAAQVRRVAGEMVGVMQALSGVAARIDYPHLDVWLAIARQLRAIEQERDSEQLVRLVVQMLGDVVRFDELYLM
ncbi:MAG: hypothetical protein G8237_08645 [Magnetococcales bacterium]|nr:hypothetical protein [Magnetococcales bacterium]